VLQQYASAAQTTLAQVASSQLGAEWGEQQSPPGT